MRRFDRYVHLPSNRSYHLLESPPKSLSADGTLVDDETGEPLVQVSALLYASLPCPHSVSVSLLS
jgi:hypothetical protein